MNLSSLRERLGFFHETLRQLIVIDPSGSFIKQRLFSELRMPLGRKAKLLVRVLPLGSLRYRVIVALAIAGLRTEVALTSRLPGRGDLHREFTDEVRRVQSDSRPLHFESPSTTEVTVVIPVYNSWSVTEDCLRSLLMTSNDTSYRVVVVDDASTDETPQRLAAIDGIEVVSLEENCGFLRAVHAGVAHASTPYVVLLNNDTIVTNGWIDALLRLAKADDRVAFVGSQLLYPNGLLQEAGGLIFSTGSGANYGKGDAPGRSWYQFPREVDYCSGASVLLRRSAWDEVGGFDLDFAPAYYEETDFCFALRRAGYRVMYQPASRVYHLEGQSYGTDMSPTKRALMDRNRERLVTKWSAEMAQQWSPAIAHQAVAAWRSERGRLLIVDSNVPKTDQDSGSIRMFEMVKILKKMGFAVTFMTMRRDLEEPYTSAMRQLEVEVVDGRQLYAQEIMRIAPDLRVAILSRPDEAQLTEPIIRTLAPRATIIYDIVDLHYVREARRADFEDNPAIAAEARDAASFYKDIELGLVTRCDATLVVTDVEKTILAAEVPSATVVEVSNIHAPIPRVGNFDSRRDIMFVGNFNHLPNRDAVEWFLREIFPEVRTRIPGVTFKIIGSNMPDSIAQLGGDGVEILGWVHDLKPLYSSIRLVVAPLRYGAGIKGKLGESAAYGVPFVCTSIATEGTYMAHERDCLNADSADEFADAVVRLYNDESLWETISHNVQGAIEAQCAPAVAEKALRELFSELGVA